jgi:putative ABC transport system permease protein
MSNAMRRVSLRNLAAHKVRLLLTLISVILGTAFIAGSFVFTATLSSSFNKIFKTAFQNVDTRVTAAKDYDPGVPTSLIATIQALPGVRAVQPEVTGQVVLVNAAGKRAASGGAPSEGGMWRSSTGQVSPPPTLDSGRAPAAPGEVAINASAARTNHIAVGDHVKVVLANAGVVPATVTGIYHTRTDTGGYVGVLFAEQQALQLFTDGSHVNALDVAALPGVSQQTLTDRITAALPSGIVAKTGAQARHDLQSMIQSAVSFVTYFLLAFGTIALVVGTFIIYNTFTMLVAQRLRELALLRAIGASRRQVRRSVLMEAAATGLLGSALGIVGGLGLAFGLKALLNALNTGLPNGALILTAPDAVIVLVVGTAATVLSAYAPARRAAKVPPVAAMREEFATQTATSLRRRTLIGTGLLVVGALVTTLGALGKSGGSSAALTGLGLLAMCVASLALSPLLARWFIEPLGRLVGRPFGTVGRLARTNAVRNPRRTAATAFALTLGLLIVSGIGVIGSTAKKSINHLFDTSVRADLILSSHGRQLPVPLPAAAAAKTVPGVASLTELHLLSASVDGQHAFGTGIDGPLAAVMDVKVHQGVSQPAAGTILISQKYATDHGWKLGSSHSISNPTYSPISLRVAGIYADDPLLGPWLVDGQVYRALTPSTQWSDIVALARVSAGADQAHVQSAVESAVNDFYIVDVLTRAQYKGQIASQIDGLVNFVYGLLLLAIIIAVLGIINTLALSVVERRREMGMLRAIGMLRKQVRRTVYLESALIAVFGAALGIVLGLAYGTLFAHDLKGQGLDRLSLPVAQSLAFLVLAALVGVLAAGWPAWRAARTKPLDAITSE